MELDSSGSGSSLDESLDSTSASASPSGDSAHICICVCTFRRPEYLRRLLAELSAQKTEGLFTYSVVVADNDRLRSAESVVAEFAGASSIPIRYCVEPEQNIAMARNKAVSYATGDFIAFIDDDEIPQERWLLTLFEACRKYEVDGALGPVKPQFIEGTPTWVIKGKFYDRPTYKTGFIIDATKGRTGNVLLKKSIFADIDKPFGPQFRSGEDQDFFRRMIQRGNVFIWCEEALAYEVVPPARCKRRFLLRRALLRGEVAPLHANFGVRDILKSLVALPAYCVALPFAFLAGQHRFMTLLVKTCDHLGRLLSCLGITPIKVAYVTE